MSCFEFGYDSVGNDLYDFPLKGSDNFVNCQYACQKHPHCEFFAFNMRGDPPENDGCWLKTKTRVPQPRPHVVLGPKHCTGVYIMHRHGYTLIYVLDNPLVTCGTINEYFSYWKGNGFPSTSTTSSTTSERNSIQ